jgi:hypothetical protein
MKLRSPPRSKIIGPRIHYVGIAAGIAGIVIWVLNQKTGGAERYNRGTKK